MIDRIAATAPGRRARPLRVHPPCTSSSSSRLSSTAAQPEPRATATLSADGQYDVRIVPDVAWLSAEITIDGSATDVGPVEADVPFDVIGSTAKIGTLSVQVMAVTRTTAA